MPITSQQIGGMIGGQQAMFGNFASYSQQISPGFQGSPPAYSNPMAGGHDAFAPHPLAESHTFGTRAVSAIGNIGLPALGTAAMLGGSMLPGRVGNFFAGLDPMTAGLRGFGAGSGITAGGQGIFAGLRNVASGGLGSIARAGIGGIGGAFAAALPAYAASKALSFGVGQMVQGSQFEGQVQGVLGQQFRHLNPASHTGFGFDREQGGQIADMIRTMGHKDMMSGPQELLRVMKGGSQMGLFRAVQDVKEFKKRFTDMVGSLKSISETMGTTLEGAMPFFQAARQQGFWTPGDISRHAQTTRATAQATGMSVAQTQQMMGQGAQMARSVGAMGWTGSQGMAQTMQLVGGGLRSGVISNQEMREATGGLSGQDAIQSMAGTLQAATTRFAASNQARWLLAAAGERGFKGLNPGKMADLMSGTMTLGQIGAGARRNISQQGAFNFVNNEKDLRGELIKQGPAAQLGFIRTLVGGSLYGTGGRDKLITRRLMQRYFGVGGRQADMLAKLAREAPNIMQQNEARSASVTDQEERNRNQLMDRSWEGIKRKVSHWWDSQVKDPLQKLGADVGRQASEFWEKAGDKLFGATPLRHRLRGIGATGMHALQRSAMGDTRIMEQTFGKSGDFHSLFGAAGGGSLGGLSVDKGAFRSFRGMGGLTSGFLNMAANVTGSGSLTNTRIEALRGMGASEYAFQTPEERDKAIRSQGLVAGRTYGGSGHHAYRAFDRSQVEDLTQGLGAAVTGRLSTRSAAALGFESEQSGKELLKAAQNEMKDSGFRRAAASLADTTGLSGRKLAEAQVKAIEAGKMGGSALRKLLKGSKDMATKVHRVAAAQNPAMRGLVGGIDLSGEAKQLGLDVFTGMEDLESRIGDMTEDAEKRLAGALTTALGGEGSAAAKAEARWSFDPRKMAAASGLVTPHVIESLTKKGGANFKRAMMLMASGRTPEERAENKAKAMKLIADMSSDKKFTAAERQALQAMGDEKNPAHAVVKSAAEGLGKAFQHKERAAFAETTMRRSQRMMKSMGDRGEQVLDSLDKVRASGTASLGQIVRDLRDTTDPEEYTRKMQALVSVSGQADPDQVARAAAMLKGVSGAEHIVAALQGGRQAGQLTKALAGKDSGRAAMAANIITGGLAKLSKEDMKVLAKGGSEADKLIEAKAKMHKEGSFEYKRTSDLLHAMSNKDPTKLLELTRQQITARSLGLLSDPKKSILHSQVRQMKPGEVNGQLGSPTGMHTEMIKQSLLLSRIANAVEEGKGPTKNPSEDPVSGKVKT